MSAVVSTLVSELSKPEERGQNVVLLESFWSYGTILAAVLAAFVLPVIGYSILMWIISPTALYVVYILKAIPEPFKKEKKNQKLIYSKKWRKLLLIWLACFS